MTRETKRHHVDARLEVRTDGDPLPAGIAGRVAGVALTYGTVDSYGTMFQRGAAARSINGKVKARKVPLLMDHDRSVASHVGVVQTAAIPDAVAADDPVDPLDPPAAVPGKAVGLGEAHVFRWGRGGDEEVVEVDGGVSPGVEDLDRDRGGEADARDVSPLG